MTIDNHNRDLSRRRLLTLGTATLATGLLSAKSGLALAESPLLGSFSPTYFRYKLGDFEITTISDGGASLDKVFPIFGGNTSEEEVAKVMKENHAAPNKLNLHFTPTVINTGKQLVLIDTGNGDDGFAQRPYAGNLVKQLAVAGYKPEQIDIIVISHGHSDHIGGIKEAGKPVFPNASYVISEVEFDFWNNKDKLPKALEGFAKVFDANTEGLKEKFRTIKPGEEIVTGIEAVATYGHTPGHLSFNVESNGQRVFIMNDCAHNAVASFARPDWHFAFDADKEMGAQTRAKVFDMCAKDQLSVISYHMPYPGLGRIVKKDSVGYRWIGEAI